MIMNNEMQDLKFTTAGDFMKMSEEPHHNYCTTKGLGWAFLIIIIGMVGMPILGSAIAYPDNCKQSILIPCLGLGE
jgi:hypothetical protein